MSKLLRRLDINAGVYTHPPWPAKKNKALKCSQAHREFPLTPCVPLILMMCELLSASPTVIQRPDSHLKERTEQNRKPSLSQIKLLESSDSHRPPLSIRPPMATMSLARWSRLARPALVRHSLPSSSPLHCCHHCGTRLFPAPLAPIHFPLVSTHVCAPQSVCPHEGAKVVASCESLTSPRSCGWWG